MSYDPESHGAMCSRCPLRGSIVVPPEIARRAKPFAILVGEAPGEREEEALKPFVGPAGWELMRAMQAVGLRRADCHVTNAILCRPASNKLDRVELDVTRRNKAIEDPNQKWLDPVAACRPRLRREIASYVPANVITLGGTAYRAVTGSREKPMSIRGGPQERGFGRLLPTLHPSFVMRSRRWTHAFMADLGRAVRWFSTGLRWQDPETIYLPTPDVLRAWLEREVNSPFVIYDVETAPAFPEAGRYDAMHDYLRVVGLASYDARRAISIPFRSIEDPKRTFYSISDYKEIIEALKLFFTSPKWRKGGQNSGYYDRMVIESHFHVTPAPHVDLINLHKFTEPELPHGLDYIGSVYTDIHSWKQGKPAEEAESDQALWLYNVRDCAVTALSVAPLAEAVRARNQTRQAAFWPFLQDLCVDLHKVGMHVDQKKRLEWDTKLLHQAETHLKVIREGARISDFNPGSVRQVSALLFDSWDLMPVEYTELGEPSTGDDSLRSILAKQELSPEKKDVIQNIRLYRRRIKYRGTYTQKLRPMKEAPIGDFFADDDEESFEDRQYRIRKSLKKPGIVLEDGRVHGDWNGHGTLGWRLSSSGPNLQNVPDKLREIFDEEPGWCLVACDQAQLELRLGAALARSEAYIRAFTEKRDPHLEFCLDIFGDSYRSASKGHAKALRRFVKELTYASEYRAEVETVHAVLTASEDEEERLLYPDITIAKVAAFHRKWLDRAKFDQWWEETDAEYARQGFLLDPILGLRCDFLDGFDDPQIGNKLVNFKCQQGGAAIVHLATKRFLTSMPKAWTDKVRLVNQGHDALVARVKKDHDGPQIREHDETGKITGTKWCVDPNCGCLPSRVAKFLEECFTFDGKEFGLPVNFLGEGKIGNTWREV